MTLPRNNLAHGLIVLAILLVLGGVLIYVSVLPNITTIQQNSSLIEARDQRLEAIQKSHAQSQDTIAEAINQFPSGTIRIDQMETHIDHIKSTFQTTAQEQSCQAKMIEPSTLNDGTTLPTHEKSETTLKQYRLKVVLTGAAKACFTVLEKVAAQTFVLSENLHIRSTGDQSIVISLSIVQPYVVLSEATP